VPFDSGAWRMMLPWQLQRDYHFDDRMIPNGDIKPAANFNPLKEEREILRSAGADRGCPSNSLPIQF